MRLNDQILLESSVFSTYCKEQPLQLLTVALRVRHRITRELVIFVKLLSEVDEDGWRLENVETIVRDCRDTPIWVDLCRKLIWELITIKATNFEEPRGLDLVVNLTNIGVHDAHLHNPADSIVSAFTSDAIRVLTHNPVRRMQPVTGFRQYAMDLDTSIQQWTFNSSRRMETATPLGVGKE